MTPSHGFPAVLSMPMKSRRFFIGTAIRICAVAAALPIFRPLRAFAAEKRNANAFSAKSFAEVAKALGGEAPKLSTDVMITLPEIAESGAVVPVKAESKLAGTKAVHILVEKNALPLSGTFDIPAGTDPFVETRVKVGATSNVIALVQTDSGFFYAQKLVKVTLGGCGG